MQKVQPPDAPILTTKELYLDLETKVKKDGASGKKSAEIKQAIIDVAAEIGQTDLLQRALFPIIRTRLGKSVPRGNYVRVCEQNWEVSTDEEGLVHIDLSHPKASKKTT